MGGRGVSHWPELVELASLVSASVRRLQPESPAAPRTLCLLCCRYVLRPSPPTPQPNHLPLRWALRWALVQATVTRRPTPTAPCCSPASWPRWALLLLASLVMHAGGEEGGGGSTAAVLLRQMAPAWCLVVAEVLTRPPLLHPAPPPPTLLPCCTPLAGWPAAPQVLASLVMQASLLGVVFARISNSSGRTSTIRFRCGCVRGCGCAVWVCVGGGGAGIWGVKYGVGDRHDAWSHLHPHHKHPQTHASSPTLSRLPRLLCCTVLRCAVSCLALPLPLLPQQSDVDVCWA